MLRWLQSAQAPSKYILNIKEPLPNPFLGLALEEHWFKRLNFEENSDKKLILLWRNQPTVVVGKFQNLWSECHSQYCRAHGVFTARRSSGGGTVFHDTGNLNITVFATNKNYKRKDNLQLVKSTLEQSLGYDDLEINDRDDLLWKGKKISGTAAKLNAKKSYHHFTLLFNSDKELLSECLRSPLRGWDLKCKATKSVPSPTNNLLPAGSTHAATENAISKFSKGLVRVVEDSLAEEGMPRKRSQARPIYDEVHSFGDLRDLGEDSIDFNEIDTICDELESWDWVYGKSPKFVLNDKEIVKGKLPNGKRFYL